MAAAGGPNTAPQPSYTLPHPPITSITPEAASISSTSPTVTSTAPGPLHKDTHPNNGTQQSTLDTISSGITSISHEPEASPTSTSGAIPTVTSIAAGGGGGWGEGPSGTGVSSGWAWEKKYAPAGGAQLAEASTSGAMPADITGLLCCLPCTLHGNHVFGAVLLCAGRHQSGLHVVGFSLLVTVYFPQAFSVSGLFTNSEPNACGGFSRRCLSRRKSIVST